MGGNANAGAAATKILTLATESLDMLRAVTAVFKESLDKADAYVVFLFLFSACDSLFTVSFYFRCIDGSNAFALCASSAKVRTPTRT